MNNKGIYIIIVCLLFISCNLIRPEIVYDNIFKLDYQPFKEGTKAEVLPEASRLKLKDNLPRLDGATALYPLYSAFVQAVYPKDDYYPYSMSRPLVGVSTTSEAYKYLIEGKVDLIFCAKPSAEQIELAEVNGLSLNMTPIGKEAFVFFVHKKNSIANLTTDEVIGIYSGKITNWSELNGKRNNIKVYQRSKNSGSQTMLESIMGNTEIIEPLTENVIDFMGGMINQVSVYKNYKNAIGYSFLFYTTRMVQNDSIKLLSINDIFPSRETIQNGTYPYSDEFYAITTNTENENVNMFIEWILSEQGQYLVEKTGYVPIK